jgi:hypothetical protein
MYRDVNLGLFMQLGTEVEIRETGKVEENLDRSSGTLVTIFEFSETVFSNMQGAKVCQRYFPNLILWVISVSPQFLNPVRWSLEL